MSEETYKPILVDIAIPTYNRLPFLKETIEGLLKEILKQNRVVFRIVVADGGSDDGTREWIAQAEKDGLLKCLSPAVGLGYPARLRALVELSEADYVWFFGDDDKISGTCLKQIEERLLAKQIGALFLDYDVWNSDFSSLEQSGMLVAKFLESTDLDVSLASLGQSLGFLSAVILHRETASAAMHLGFDVQSASWPYMGWIFYSARTRGFEVLRKSLVLQRGANSAFGSSSAGWYGPFVFEWQFFVHFAKRLGASPKSLRLLSAAPFREGNLTWRRIVGERMRASSHPRHLFLRLFTIYWSYPSFWLQCAPVFFIPKCALLFIRKILRKLPTGSSR